MPESERKPPEENSRGQRKREAEALQELGAELMRLTASELATLDLPERLFAAIKEGHRLTANEAKRRHLQYIGKLMRTVEVEPLKLAIKNAQTKAQKATSEFHEIEAWRDRLIAGDDTVLQQFLELHPTADRNHLRQLIRNAKQDIAKQKDTGGSTKLFRYIRDVAE
jgi:ribosome-associated protein